MLKFISWKFKRIKNMNQREGFIGLLKFMIEKLKEKTRQRIKALDRPVKETLFREEFIDLWRKTQTEQPSFRVLLLVTSFLDMDGVDFMQGGAERYTVELNRLIQDLGGRLEVYQCGHSNWYRQFSGVSVYGLDTNGFNSANLNRAFHQWVKKGVLTIYYQMVLSTPEFHSPSICVSHGVDWDAHWLQNKPDEYQLTIQNILASIANVTRMVSVDTNTINWLRATEVKLAEKCRYIPNFVDMQYFKPVTQPHSSFVILYPRRLSEARGFWLVARTIPRLFERYSQLELNFCGKAEPFEQAEVNHLCEIFPNRVRWFDTPPDQMVRVYQSADLVVIPTTYSEGTSLSCLEAMASRRPVIATNVGGLPDLIIPGYNGIMIEPNEEEFFDAVCQMIDNPELRDQLAEKGYETAKAFDVAIWRRRWKETLLETTDCVILKNQPKLR